MMRKSVQNCTFLFRLRRTDALPSKNYVALKTAIMSTAKSASRLRRHAREPALHNYTLLRQQSVDIFILSVIQRCLAKAQF